MHTLARHRPEPGKDDLPGAREARRAVGLRCLGDFRRRRRRSTRRPRAAREATGQGRCRIGGATRSDRCGRAGHPSRCRGCARWASEPAKARLAPETVAPARSERSAKRSLQGSRAKTLSSTAAVTTSSRSVSKISGAVSPSAGGAATWVAAGTTPSEALPAAGEKVSGARAGCGGRRAMPEKIEIGEQALVGRTVEALDHDLGEAREDAHQRIAEIAGAALPVGGIGFQQRAQLPCDVDRAAGIDRRCRNHRCSARGRTDRRG